MTKIELGKKYMTRGGTNPSREVEILSVTGLNEKYPVIGRYKDTAETKEWRSDGLYFFMQTMDSAFDLVPMPESQKGEPPELSEARRLLAKAASLCDEIGFNIETLLHEVTRSAQLIDMSRKWKLRATGDKVTILTVTAPQKDYPVIGYMDSVGNAMCWTATGRHYVNEESGPCDLVPDEGEQ